jgi:ABC-type amino acid transport substrate-binding protein
VVAATTLTACGADDPSTSASGGGNSSGDNPALFDTLPDKIKSSGAVTLGALWETPPVISVTASNTSTPVGIAPELADALAPLLGVDMKWKNMQWPAQLPGVQAGAVDALFGQVTITEDREQSVVDLVPFSKATMSLLMSADDADGVTSLADMCGKKLGVPVGSVQTQEVEEASKSYCGSDEIEIESYQGATLAINAVKAGTVTAWLDNSTSQDAAVKADSSLAAVVMPDEDIAPQYTGIAVGKKLPGLTNALVDGLRQLIDDGTYAEILEKYDSASSAVTADEVKANPLTGTAVGSTN